MNIRAICAVAILLFAVSCTKDEATTLPDPPEDNSPLLMTKRTFTTTLADGQQIIDSFAYEYDDKGQIVKHTNLNLGTYFTLQYVGDVVDLIIHYNNRGVKVLTQINVMKRVGDGNTILWDQSTKALNGGIDTVYYYYTFKERQLQSIRRYRHDQVDNMPWEDLITYTYDGQGNPQFVTVKSGSHVTRYTITGNDGKKNPYRLLAPSSLIYLNSDNFYIAGNANPLKTESPGFTPIVYSYTYNDSGYPLNMKIGTGYDVSYEYTPKK